MTTVSRGNVAFADVEDRPVHRRFLTGVSFAASGIGVALGDRRLVVLCAVPMVVHAALYGALLYAGFAALDDVVAWVDIEPGHWWSFLADVVAVAWGVVVVVGGVVVAVFAGGVVCDPLYDLVSERVEERAVGRSAGDAFSVGRAVRGIVRELGVTGVRLAVYVVGLLAIQALHLIPLVGSVASAVVGACWTWLFLCYEYVSRSLARHAASGQSRMTTLFQHKALALGFGLAAQLMMFIPILAPFLVVGGTRLFLALAAHGRVASRFTDEERARLRA